MCIFQWVIRAVFMWLLIISSIPACQVYELASPPPRAPGPSTTSPLRMPTMAARESQRAMLGGLSKAGDGLSKAGSGLGRAVVHGTQSVGRGISSASGAVAGSVKQVGARSGRLHAGLPAIAVKPAGCRLRKQAVFKPTSVSTCDHPPPPACLHHRASPSWLQQPPMVRRWWPAG